MVEVPEDALSESVSQMIGEIDRVLSFGDGLKVAVIVSSLDEDETSDEDAGFFCVTMGLSNHERTGEIPRAELVISADGTFSDTAVDGCAEDLARLALATSNREGRTDDVFSFQWSHVYSNMSAVVVTDYMLTGPDTLYGIEPKIRLLTARPIFADEARWIEKVGAVAANQRFVDLSISWRNPWRAHATPPMTVITQRGDDMKEKTLDLRSIWTDLEKWFDANKATATIGALRKGASEKEIAELQGAFGAPIPSDLAESLKIHNGRPSVDSYMLLAVKTIINSFDDLPSGKVAAPDREHKVKPLAWSPHWLPFAEDGGGNRYCIDLDPGEKGTRGQVIRWERNLLSAGATCHASFSEWLYAYRQDLFAGKFEVDEEGFVNRK